VIALGPTAQVTLINNEGNKYPTLIEKWTCSKCMFLSIGMLFLQEHVYLMTTRVFDKTRIEELQNLCISKTSKNRQASWNNQQIPGSFLDDYFLFFFKKIVEPWLDMILQYLITMGISSDNWSRFGAVSNTRPHSGLDTTHLFTVVCIFQVESGWLVGIVWCWDLNQFDSYWMKVITNRLVHYNRIWFFLHQYAMVNDTWEVNFVVSSIIM
jgi:hypothetical protein